MSQKDDRDLDAPSPPGSPMRRDEPSPPQRPEPHGDEQEDRSEEEG